MKKSGETAFQAAMQRELSRNEPCESLSAIRVGTLYLTPENTTFPNFLSFLPDTPHFSVSGFSAATLSSAPYMTNI